MNNMDFIYTSQSDIRCPCVKCNGFVNPHTVSTQSLTVALTALTGTYTEPQNQTYVQKLAEIVGTWRVETMVIRNLLRWEHKTGSHKRAHIPSRVNNAMQPGKREKRLRSSVLSYWGEWGLAVWYSPVGVLLGGKSNASQ